MDDSDGLAGGLTLFGFSAYGLAAWPQGDVVFSGVDWSVAAVSLAFLFFNFHPTRIFVGNAGSITLGFLAATFGLLGWRAGYWPLWFPVFVFSPFILGASATWAIALDGRIQLIFGIAWGLAYLLAMRLVDTKWSRMQRPSKC